MQMSNENGIIHQVTLVTQFQYHYHSHEKKIEIRFITEKFHQEFLKIHTEIINNDLTFDFNCYQSNPIITPEE